MPKQPELPVVTLSADGTMASRRWICALQQAIDRCSEAEEAERVAAEAAAAAAATAAAASATATATGDPDAADPNAAVLSTPPPMPSRREVQANTDGTLQTVVSKLGEFVEFGSSKIDELDRSYSGKLAEQSHRTEMQLATLAQEKSCAAADVVVALDEFTGAMDSQMAEELLRISAAELEYHQGMAAHLTQLVASLRANHRMANQRTSQPPVYSQPPPARTSSSYAAAAAATAAGAAVGASVPAAIAPTTPTIEASLAPVEPTEEDVLAAEDEATVEATEEDAVVAGSGGGAEEASMPGGRAEDEDETEAPAAATARAATAPAATVPAATATAPSQSSWADELGMVVPSSTSVPMPHAIRDADDDDEIVD